MQHTVYAIALLASFLFSGCIAQVPHSPNPNLLGELGFQEAAAEFEELMNGLRKPQAFDTHVDVASFEYHYAGAYSLYWGAVPIGDGVAQILWDEIKRVDIFENGKAFLFGAGNRRVGHEGYLFHSVAEATRFSDLIASFRAGPPAESGGAPSEAEQSPWAEEERQHRSGAPR